MAKLPASGVTITLDDSGGTPRIVTSFVLQMGGLKITNETMESTPYGATFRETITTGIRKGEKISLSGLVDNTATTGTFATMLVTTADAVPGFTRTLTIVTGGGAGSTFAGEMILESSTIESKIGLATYQAELQPSGSVAWS